MRHLIGKKERNNEARRFHDEVLELRGRVCMKCGRRDHLQAAHAIKRAHLGPLRYSSPHLAGVLCAWCHPEQERGEWEFPLWLRRDAIKHHNAIAKIKLVMP